MPILASLPPVYAFRYTSSYFKLRHQGRIIMTMTQEPQDEATLSPEEIAAQAVGDDPPAWTFREPHTDSQKGR